MAEGPKGGPPAVALRVERVIHSVKHPVNEGLVRRAQRLKALYAHEHGMSIVCSDTVVNSSTHDGARYRMRDRVFFNPFHCFVGKSAT